MSVCYYYDVLKILMLLDWKSGLEMYEVVHSCEQHLSLIVKNLVFNQFKSYEFIFYYIFILIYLLHMELFSVRREIAKGSINNEKITEFYLFHSRN